MVAGSSYASYFRGNNVPFETRGALALWIRPENWPSASGNCYFIGNTNNPYLQLFRNDADQQVQVQLKLGAEKFPTGYIWENDRWHLLLINWSWPHVALSINGGAFARYFWGRDPERDFEGFHIGTPKYGSGSDCGLLDEVMIFRRPLKQEEVETLYNQLAP